jgi:hypothetical protein
MNWRTVAPGVNLLLDTHGHHWCPCNTCALSLPGDGWWKECLCCRSNDSYISLPIQTDVQVTENQAS